MEITENRLKHIHAVAVKMKELAIEKPALFPVSPEKAFILGMLHDIGYEFANEQREHANTGGNILREQGYKYWQEVYYHGIPQTDYDSVMLRLLNYADMITGPDGTYMSIEERIRDIAKRYGEDSLQVKEATKLAEQIKRDNIVVSLATKADAAEIHNLMKTVYEQLEDKTLYVCDDLEYVNEHISGEGFAVKACNFEGKIIASFIFRYPGLQEDNLGRDIELVNDEELCKVVHMESAVVLPEYRGRGIQSKMLSYAEKLIDKDKYKYFVATVSPNNPASYRSFEKNGYELKITKEKYGGLIRRIYLKDATSER